MGVITDEMDAQVVGCNFSSMIRKVRRVYADICQWVKL